MVAKGNFSCQENQCFTQHASLAYLQPQGPVPDPCFAVGFLPLPSSGLRVGQLVTMNWRVERLKDSDKNAAFDDLERNFTYYSVFQYSSSPKYVVTSSEG